MLYTVIDIPGYNHTSQHGWHPELKSLLENGGHEVKSLDLPGGKYPVFTNWYPIIEKAVQEARYPVVLMGHSLGTRAVVLFLEKTLLIVNRIVLIAPFDNNTRNASFRDGNYANFFSHEVDINGIKNHIQDKVLIIGSEDDMNIPYIQAQNIAADLEGELISIPNSGHFLDAKWAKVLSEIVVK